MKQVLISLAVLLACSMIASFLLGGAVSTFCNCLFVLSIIFCFIGYGDTDSRSGLYHRFTGTRNFFPLHERIVEESVVNNQPGVSDVKGMFIAGVTGVVLSLLLMFMFR